MKMLVVDLFCGLGGFSQAFRDRGHRVIGVDIVPPADVIADVRHLPFNGRLRPDVVLASPPCQEFTKAFCAGWMKQPYDLDKGKELVTAAIKAINALQPRWWMLENVKGCAKFAKDILGLPFMKLSSRYLWGHFPMFLVNDAEVHHKSYRKGRMRSKPNARNPRFNNWTAAGNKHCERLGLAKNESNRSRARAIIPYEISLRLCEAMERS